MPGHTEWCGEEHNAELKGVVNSLWDRFIQRTSSKCSSHCSVSCGQIKVFTTRVLLPFQSNLSALLHHGKLIIMNYLYLSVLFLTNPPIIIILQATGSWFVNKIQSSRLHFTLIETTHSVLTHSTAGMSRFRTSAFLFVFFKHNKVCVSLARDIV